MDIYQNLKKDHDDVKSLLNELLSLSEKDDYRYILIETIASELIPHSRAEEAIFYNTLRAMDANTGLVMHSYKEHMEAEGLLRLLQTKDKINFNWKETAQKLKEELEHHIQEEESKIFSIAQNLLTNEEAEQIGNGFVELKGEYKKNGAVMNTAEMLINLLPPRFASKVHNLHL
jgi:iron-sulfur cluster repair protein YtfE (RIC family)